MGLLDGFTMSDDQKGALMQGLLSAGFGAMAGRGTRLQAIGQGGLAGLLGYNHAIGQQQDRAQQAQAQQFRDMQMQQMRSQMEEQQRARQVQEQIRGAAQASTVAPQLDNTSEAGPVMPTSGGFDSKAFIDRVSQIDPLRAIELRQTLNKTEAPIKVGAGESLYDPNTGKTVFTAPKEAAPTELSRLIGEMNALPEGDPRRSLYMNAISKTTTHQPGSNVSVKVDNKMGEGVAAQVGPMVKATQDAAVGAVNQADAADRVLRAVNSGNVIAGPGASFRLFGAQVGQTLGVSGRNATEQLQNTREVIRGLAEFSLNARKSLAGQGQITENEQKLLDRAVSGDIDSLTPLEISQIAQITRRQAQRTHQAHERNVGRLKSNPTTAGLADYYEVPAFPAAPQSGAPGRVRRYNPQTGGFE